jgi:hypothetical protein
LQELENDVLFPNIYARNVKVRHFFKTYLGLYLRESTLQFNREYEMSEEEGLLRRECAACA